MKKCSACGVEKSTTEFQKRAKSKDGLANRCRPCKRDYDNAHYAAHKETRAPYIAANREKVRNELREVVREHLSSHPCVDCGDTRFAVLDFDHRDRATKSNSISNLLHNVASRATLLAEIAKCDVRCANCHRIRTANQFGWKKLSWT